LKLGVIIDWAYQSEELIIGGGGDTVSGSFFHFPHHCGMGDLNGF